VGAGAKLELNLLALMGSRATIGGSTLRSRSRDDKAAVARAVEEHVLPLLADGSVAVAVAEQLPMDAAGQAYERFAAGGKFGKIVLVNR
jgi:NADPH:quinone reductase-like Zn-dependent oxidoreductase